VRDSRALNRLLRVGFALFLMALCLTASGNPSQAASLYEALPTAYSSDPTLEAARAIAGDRRRCAASIVRMAPDRAGHGARRARVGQSEQADRAGTGEQSPQLWRDGAATDLRWFRHGCRHVAGGEPGAGRLRPAHRHGTDYIAGCGHRVHERRARRRRAPTSTATSRRCCRRSSRRRRRASRSAN
jgi:hypothetical protein